MSIKTIIQNLSKKYTAEPEYVQAVTEVLDSLETFLEENPKYTQQSLLERMVEPERVLQFRVPWTKDDGSVKVNTGYRVQFNSVLGPYKGGLRFHPSVTLGTLKFLGFEQIFKNSLTGLPLGGGKGGSDFDPKGKSDQEIMRFCQSFMTELTAIIGPDTDVPAGDIGVGGREIGYMFGQYKKLTKTHVGVLTGKGYGWGGSLIRPEATGYGLVYFVTEMLKHKNQTWDNQKVAISGAGNVAQFAAEKVLEMGGKVISLSDSGGTLWFKNGLSAELLQEVMELKNTHRGRLSELKDLDGVEYLEGKKPWEISQIDIALPCATQNEIDEKDAEKLIKNGAKIVGEGANMPTTPEATELLNKNGVWIAPAKAANAGGVGVSGLEMTQNSQRLYWTREEVDAKLQTMMQTIFAMSVKYAKDENGKPNLAVGANIAGFIRVADGMIAQGIV